MQKTMPIIRNSRQFEDYFWERLREINRTRRLKELHLNRKIPRESIKIRPWYLKRRELPRPISLNQGIPFDEPKRYHL